MLDAFSRMDTRTHQSTLFVSHARVSMSGLRYRSGTPWPPDVHLTLGTPEKAKRPSRESVGGLQRSHHVVDYNRTNIPTPQA